jgi:hypothetical protein|tara:strand:+ start:12375 stop:12728 length:354 start_codon:yes stop_codon:yes gene_type:complete
MEPRNATSAQDFHPALFLIRLDCRKGTRHWFFRWMLMRAYRFNQSSMIERVAFDDDAHTLSISFRQTGKYLYYDVPATIFDELCKAVSVGTYFNEQIKGRFACRRDPERRRFGPKDE